MLESEAVARLIGHDFLHPELLAEALTHPSTPLPPKGKKARRGAVAKGHYQRLEFLGDRVLGLVVAEILWRRFPAEDEGRLTRRYAELVRADSLAAIAAGIGLGQHITTSPAEAASGAAHKTGILSDVLEAVIAAIYLDGGLAPAAAFIERFWGPHIVMMELPPRNPKEMLQEWVQARGLPLPAYQLVATSGPAHAPRLTVTVTAGSAEASATAASKRAAETGAAEALLARLGDKAVIASVRKKRKRTAA